MRKRGWQRRWNIRQRGRNLGLCPSRKFGLHQKVSEIDFGTLHLFLLCCPSTGCLPASGRQNRLRRGHPWLSIRCDRALGRQRIFGKPQQDVVWSDAEPPHSPLSAVAFAASIHRPIENAIHRAYRTSDRDGHLMLGENA